LNKAQAVLAGPLFTLIETASNKSNQGFTQSTLLSKFKNIDYVTANQPKFKANHYKQKEKQL